MKSPLELPGDGPELTAALRRIAEFEAALRPFAAAARHVFKADAHHGIEDRTDDESVGVVVDYGALKRAAKLVK